MAKYIQTEFINMLKKEPWMDDKTRQTAIEKANAIIFNMAYPDELTDDKNLNGYFRDLQLQPNSLLQSVLRVRNFAKNKKIHDLREPILRNDWREIAPHVTQVDAFYFLKTNSVCKFYNRNKNFFSIFNAA